MKREYIDLLKLANNHIDSTICQKLEAIELYAPLFLLHWNRYEALLKIAYAVKKKDQSSRIFLSKIPDTIEVIKKDSMTLSFDREVIFGNVGLKKMRDVIVHSNHQMDSDTYKHYKNILDDQYDQLTHSYEVFIRKEYKYAIKQMNTLLDKRIEVEDQIKALKRSKNVAQRELTAICKKKNPIKPEIALASGIIKTIARYAEQIAEKVKEKKEIHSLYMSQKSYTRSFIKALPTLDVITE